MKTSMSILALCAALLAVAAAPAAARAQAPGGVWLWDNGDAAVAFHPCGAELCARIVWVKNDPASGAEPLRDRLNPNPALRTRAICGLDYVTGLKMTKSGEWRSGRIYDFKTGKSYDLDIDAVEPAKVRMRGYMGARLLGANLTLVRPGAAPQFCGADGQPQP